MSNVDRAIDFLTASIELTDLVLRQQIAYREALSKAHAEGRNITDEELSALRQQREDAVERWRERG